MVWDWFGNGLGFGSVIVWECHGHLGVSLFPGYFFVRCHKVVNLFFDVASLPASYLFHFGRRICAGSGDYALHLTGARPTLSFLDVASLPASYLFHFGRRNCAGSGDHAPHLSGRSRLTLSFLDMASLPG
jgi:hypothetical protein